MKKFGDKIKEIRQSLGLKKQAFAELCGWTEGKQTARISQYEKGIRTPSPEDAKKIAQVAKLTFEELIADTDYKKASLYNAEPKKIPLIEWFQIPDICKNPEKIKEISTEFVTISFEKEENLYATRIPDTRIPGFSLGLFDPKDHLLISPDRPLSHAMPVIITSAIWDEPEYAIYWIRGDQEFLKYPNERLTKKTDDIQVCGVVVARMNIFIQL